MKLMNKEEIKTAIAIILVTQDGCPLVADAKEGAYEQVEDSR